MADVILVIGGPRVAARPLSAAKPVVGLHTQNLRSYSSRTSTYIEMKAPNGLPCLSQACTWMKLFLHTLIHGNQLFLPVSGRWHGWPRIDEGEGNQQNPSHYPLQGGWRRI